MAISTGTQLKMVQVSTQAKYNDIASKDPGTLYWVVETRKIYLDGVAYGFNDEDLTAQLLASKLGIGQMMADGTELPGQIYTDNGKVMIAFSLRIDPDASNLLSIRDDGLYVGEVSIRDIAEERINTLVVNKKGQTNGFASLDNAGKVPASQLPSFVDDVLEFSSLQDFPAIGESGKIYVALNTNKTFRWGGSTYVEISPSLALGTTSSTAFRGDYGNTAYQHVSKTDNPHGVTAAQVGLGLVFNYSVASQSQAEAGTVNTAYMTPQRTKQAIDKLAPKVTWTVIS